MLPHLSAKHSLHYVYLLNYLSEQHIGQTHNCNKDKENNVTTITKNTAFHTTTTTTTTTTTITTITTTTIGFCLAGHFSKITPGMASFPLENLWQHAVNGHGQMPRPRK